MKPSRTKRPFTAAVAALHRLTLHPTAGRVALVDASGAVVVSAANGTNLENICRRNKARLGLPYRVADSTGVREWKPDAHFWAKHWR